MAVKGSPFRISNSASKEIRIFENNARHVSIPYTICRRRVTHVDHVGYLGTTCTLDSQRAIRGLKMVYEG